MWLIKQCIGVSRNPADQEPDKLGPGRDGAYREAMEGAGLAMPPTSGAATTRSVSTAVPRR